MKTLFIPFLFLLTAFISCSENSTEILEQKTISYDAYVAGRENNTACYWKNGQKTDLPGGNSLYLKKIFVENNHVYIGGSNQYQNTFFRFSAFWKDGVKTEIAQYLNIPINSNVEIYDFYVKNGDIYFVGSIYNPNASDPNQKNEFCYWKNGIKTILFTNQYSFNDSCSISVIGSQVYISGHQTINGAIQFGYFVNNTFNPIAQSHFFNKTASNNTNIYSFYKNFYTNLLTNTSTQVTLSPNESIENIMLDNNDVYLKGKTKYYKNAVETVVNDPQLVYIQDMQVLDQNIYMIRKYNNAYKFFINNVEAQSSAVGSEFHSIFVTPN